MGRWKCSTDCVKNNDPPPMSVTGMDWGVGWDFEVWKVVTGACYCTWFSFRGGVTMSLLSTVCVEHAQENKICETPSPAFWGCVFDVFRLLSTVWGGGGAMCKENLATKTVKQLLPRSEVQMRCVYVVGVVPTRKHILGSITVKRLILRYKVHMWWL